MRHEMLSQRAPFCIGAMAKKGTLSQHFRDACRTSSGFSLCTKMAAVAVCYAVTSYTNALFTMAWQNDIDPVFTVDPSHKILALTSPSCPLHKALSSDCIPSSSHAMLHPDIGKGRQIEELIIVILKFGEIEKEINAMLQ